MIGRWRRGGAAQSAAATADRMAPGRPSLPALELLAAVLAFLAVLALALGLAMGRQAAEWDAALGETATLVIAAAEISVEAEARGALEVLRATPGVRAVRMLEIDEQRSLLEPWLGAGAVLDNLPLPLMIDVTIDREVLDPDALRQRLAAEAPNAVLDDHGAWRLALIATATRLRVFALAGLGALAVALVAALYLAARARVAENSDVIATLRLAGARDGYVVRALARRMTRRAALAALVGAAAALGLLALLPRAGDPGFVLTGIYPAAADWPWLAAVPVAAVLLTMLVPGGVVRRGLRRWS